MIGRPLEKHELVDHIDGNGLNNRRSNLRLATYAQSSMNRGRNIKNSSGYKGVDLKDGKWRAEIQVSRKKVYLGRFSTPEEAYAAYCEAAKKYHGEFANFGGP